MMKHSTIAALATGLVLMTGGTLANANIFCKPGYVPPHCQAKYRQCIASGGSRAKCSEVQRRCVEQAGTCNT